METSAQQYWNNRYQSNETGWDIGYPSPPIKEYIDQLTDRSISILIPGCGNSYEAEYLIQQAFQHITLIDIAPLLTQALEKKFASYLGKQIHIITGDFFALHTQFDLILEQTFFCALDPSLRSRYVQQMHQLLKPGGKLVGVLFNRYFEGGPPFGGQAEEYLSLFAPFFKILLMEPCYNSIPPRAGSELFVRMARAEGMKNQE